MAEKENPLNAFFNSFASGEEKISFKLAHESVGEKLDSISTGSYLLDDALSSGGLPRGRLIQFYGPPGSGKSLMAMLAIKEAQKADKTALQVFFDAEQTFDPSWAAKLGINTSKIVVVDEDAAANGRKCFEMILGIPKEDTKTHEYKGKSKEGLLDQITNKKLNINLIVLDSLGSLIPPIEDVARVGKSGMASLARFLSTTFKKLSLDLTKANIPFIVINHKKDNMDPYGTDHTYSGGNSYSHYLSANVYFDPIKAKDSLILDENEEKIGHSVRATVEKSKFGPHPRRAEIKINFTEGVVGLNEEIYELALKYNVIQKTSSVTHEYGEYKWVGEGKTKEAILTVDGLADELLAKVEEAREAQRQELIRKQRELTDEVLSSSVNETAEVEETESVEEGTPKKRGRKKES